MSIFDLFGKKLPARMVTVKDPVESALLTSTLKLDRDTDLYYSTKNRAFISLKVSFNEPSTTK